MNAGTLLLFPLLWSQQWLGAVPPGDQEWQVSTRSRPPFRPETA